MEIFRSIDVKNRGFLTSADFRRLCVELDIGLSAGQMVSVFGQLDTDHDGRITGDDFQRGHRAFTELFIAGVTRENPGRDVTRVTSDVDGRASWERFVEKYGVELGLLSSVRYAGHIRSSTEIYAVVRKRAIGRRWVKTVSPFCCPQIFPTIDSLPASGLTPRLSDWSVSSEHLGFYFYFFVISLFCSGSVRQITLAIC